MRAEFTDGDPGKQYPSFHRVPTCSHDLHATDGDVVDAVWYPITETVRGRVLNTVGRFEAHIRFERDTSVEMRCGCQPGRLFDPFDGHDALCGHLHSLAASVSDSVLPIANPAHTQEWKIAANILGRSTNRPAESGDCTATLGLRFAVAADTRELLVSPAVRRSLSSGWSTAGVSWHSPGRHTDVDPAARALVAALGDLATTATGGWTPVNAFDASMWSLLSAAEAAGVHILRATPDTTVPADLHTPVTIGMIATPRADGGVDIYPRLISDTAPDEYVREVLPIGDEPHGVAWYDSALVLNLAPLAAPVDRFLMSLTARGAPVTIPDTDVADFAARGVPRIAGSVALADPDNVLFTSVVEGPTAVLSIRHAGWADDDYVADWLIEYIVDSEPVRTPAFPGEPTISRHANNDAEHDLWHRLSEHVRALDPFAGPSARPSLVEYLEGGNFGHLPSRPLSAGTLAHLIGEVLPELPPTPDLNIEISDDIPDYRPATEPPKVHFEAGSESMGRDWLSLAVTVDVGGTRFPLEQIIVDLVTGSDTIICPDGTYFAAADVPELARLAQLLQEARALGEYTTDGQTRSDSTNATLWNEICGLGEVDDELTDWAARHQSLSLTTAPTPATVPDTVHAQLRPYQQDGVSWLSFLLANRTGGILADDMGLGKTLQALTAMASTLQTQPDARFLVIAPTSIVSNWITEASRFLPSMSTAAVRKTLRKTGTARAVIDTATLVVTTYALARIDVDYYAQTEWTMKVADEGQFLKNSASLAHRKFAQIPAATTIIATGTPIENTLTDLWSLLSLSTPGLFPDKATFRTYYRDPIESGDNERLQQLKARIRPFVLRRTKAAVVTELPPKIEQTLTLDLGGKHRTIYDRRLNLERQKALDLLMEDSPQARFQVLSALTRLRQLSLHAGLVDDAHRDVTSVKIAFLCERIAELAAEGRHGHLVFSSFPTFLRLLRTALEAAGIAVAYIDGSVDATERARQIESFSAGKTTAFLISLKAGGFGLNLTTANTVWHTDPWWNPAAELQATDRAYRIGQTQTVNVYRLISADTIEEKVADLQQAKRELATAALDDGNTLSTVITADDLRELLA